jgi:hypothetical protein
MAIRIEPHSAVHLDGIRRLNQRLFEGGLEQGFLLPERTATQPADLPLTKRHYLVLDEGAVRGGLILQEQMFQVAGSLRPVANLQMPVSEGQVDRSYAHVGPAMLKIALAEHPLMFAVGMGAASQPLPRLLKAMRWKVEPVPFLFRIHHCRRFLKEIGPLRSTPLRALLSSLAAGSGAGWAGIRLVQGISGLRRRWGVPRSPLLEVREVTDWGGWADEVWQQYHLHCSAAGVRDSRTLPLLLPLDERRMIALQFLERRTPAGWTAALLTQMYGNRYFGNLKVATLLDAVALPGMEEAVVGMTCRILEERGADLIIANHTHRTWLHSMRCAGFLDGPSNYLLAMSPELTKSIGPWDAEAPLRHFSRADGDGRIHL